MNDIPALMYKYRAEWQKADEFRHNFEGWLLNELEKARQNRSVYVVVLFEGRKDRVFIGKTPDEAQEKALGNIKLYRSMFEEDPGYEDVDWDTLPENPGDALEYLGERMSISYELYEEEL